MARPSEPPVNDAVFTLHADIPRLTIAPDDAVTAVAAVAGLLWVGTSSGRLIRYNPSAGRTDEVRGRLGVGRLDNAVWRIVADPHTRAALVILRNADGYHAHGTGLVRPRWLSRLRGLRCVSATWLRVPGPSGPRPLALLGTALGAVFSLAVDSRHERDDTLSKLWNAPNSQPIDGLRVEYVAGKFVAAVATTSALYVFSDALTLPDLFVEDRLTVIATPEVAVPPQPAQEHQQLSPSSSSSKSRNTTAGVENPTPPPALHFMTGAAGATSRRFVWANAAGVTHGQLAVRRRRHGTSSTATGTTGSDEASRSAVVVSVDDKATIPWSTLRETAGAPAPLACNLSAFHALLLYPTSVYAFNHISGRLTQRVTLWSAGGPPTNTTETRAEWPGSSSASSITSASTTTTTNNHNSTSLTSAAPTLPPVSTTTSSIRSWRGVPFGSSTPTANESAMKKDASDTKRFLSSPAAGFTRDVLDDALWVYTSNGELARLSASDEEQTEAWKAAKAMGRFELAMALAPLVSSGMQDDAAVFQTREAVFEATADHAAENGDWDVAAQLYAKTNRPIETVLLSIVAACMPDSSPTKTASELNDESSSSSSTGPVPPTTTKIPPPVTTATTTSAPEKPPLATLREIGIGPKLTATRHMITYLVRKLDRIDTNKPMQRTIIATMLVQLYSSRLSSEPDENERDEIRTDFINFLADRHTDLDTGTALGVLTRNGCLEEAWNLAVLSGDMLAACELSARRGDVEQALCLLTKQAVVKDADLRSRLVSALTNSIMPIQPKRVAAAISRSLRKDSQFSDHKTVVYGLLRLARQVGDTERSQEAYQAAVTYLFDLLFVRRGMNGGERGPRESVEAGLEWQTFVTSLFALHAELGNESEAQRSFDHLICPHITGVVQTKDAKEDSDGQGSAEDASAGGRHHEPNTDVVAITLGAVLRACAIARFDRLCVFLYQALGMHERAVHLAIGLDIDLAEARVAALGEDKMSTTKRRALWAAVARGSRDPVGVVERSKGVLHIEDVLPDMGEFESASETIKAAVAGSLEEHKRLANQAKNEAAAALEVTAALREDVRKVEEWRGGEGTKQGSASGSASNSRTRSNNNGNRRDWERAIASIDAGFERGHSLPVVKLEESRLAIRREAERHAA